MYEQSFKNQAVKECVNGQTMSETARKYNVSLSALRVWIGEYRKKMKELSSSDEDVIQEPNARAVDIKESDVVLNSVNIAVDGHDITISKKDVVRLMEVFYHFDK